jgi:MarR family transcriptional regulator for hemolysin
MARGAPDLGVDLLFLLNQASYALSAEMTAALAEVGITLRDYCVLWKAQDGDQTQLLDKTTMVTTLDCLVAAGLAERRPSPTDRRARLLTLTPAGRKAVTRGTKIIDKLIADVLTTVPVRDRAAFLSGLTGLAEGRLARPAHASGPRQK